MSGDAIRIAGVDICTPLAILSAGQHSRDVTTAVDDLERGGQPVTLVCLDTSRHEHEPTRADVVHIPLVSAGVLASLVSHCIRRPGRVLGSLVRLLGNAARNPRSAVPALLRFPAALYLAGVLQRRGVTAMRGLDAVAANIALIARQACDTTPPDLSQLPVDWSRIGEPRIGLRWFSRHMNSIAAEVSVDGGNERVVVKRQRSHAGGLASDRWAHEGRILHSLREALGDGPVTVPRVIFDDRENAIVVMERARGTALDLLFVAAAGDPAVMPHLAAGVRGAGAWLAAMQAATRRTVDGGALLVELTAIAIADLTRLSAGSAIARHRHEIVRYLEKGQHSLSTRRLAVAGHHDDYWPGNIFFDGERVTVIDFESFRDGLELEDPAFFLLRCELLRNRFRLRFPDLAQRFFEGYSAGRAPDAEALSFFTVTRALRFLARGAGEGLPALQRMWTRRAIHNHILSIVRRRQHTA